MIALLAVIFEAIVAIGGALTVGASATTAVGIGALIVYALNFVQKYWWFIAATVILTTVTHNIYTSMVQSLLQSVPEPLNVIVNQAIGTTGIISVLAWFITFADLWLAYKVVSKGAAVTLGPRS